MPSSTIADIARQARVSKTTVSRVLNGRPDVDAGTAGRVLEIVAELGYVPSASARALANGRARCLGFLVPSLTLPWLLELLRGAIDEAESADHILAVHTVARGPDSLTALAALVAARAIDGLVAVVPRELGGDLDRLHRRGLPVALIDDAPPPGLPSIWTTDRAGGRDATAHLLGRGATPVAMIAGPRASPAAQQRQAGYGDALAAAACPLDLDLVEEGDWTAHGGERAMARLLARRPDLRGVFAANDLMAFGAVRAAARAGRSVPADLAVVGFDDTPAAALATPALTTVRPPLYEMGRRAARSVLDALAGRPVPESAVVLPTSLVVRASCGAAGVEEEVRQGGR